MLLTYPLMVAIQEIAGRIGRVTGRGIAECLPQFSGTPHLVLGDPAVHCEPINVAADLAAMGDATKLLIGGWTPLYVVTYAVVSVEAQIVFKYKRYVAILKWLTLVLIAYVVALAVVHVPWAEGAPAASSPRSAGWRLELWLFASSAWRSHLRCLPTDMGGRYR
jgi:Mn2+/Fe2+ NRAMP family transporter